MKAKIKFLPLFSTVFVLSLTSCAGTKDWNEAGTSLNVNYCLLQGQLDHNDSIERTRGVRDKLGTRSNNDDSLNENVQKPKENNEFEVELPNNSKRNITIKEVEHATMISTAGATWDSITANNTSTIWLNKHGSDSWTTLDGQTKRGQSITMFVSNNDGMSMGAMGSLKWPSNMPIFGFDANKNVIEAVKNGKMTGTIEPNSIGQIASMFIMLRNIAKAKDDGIPLTDEIAFANILGEESEHPYGSIQPGNVLYQDPIKGKDPRAMLSQGTALTKNPVVEEGQSKSDLQVLNGFFNEKTGEVIDCTDRAAIAEPSLLTAAKKCAERKLNVFMTFNNETDTYFSETVHPLINHFSDIYNVEFTKAYGNGGDEKKCLEAIATASNRSGYDAFIINMVKSSNAKQYIDKLKASKLYYDETTKKIKVPVIFWNKQPTDIDGNVDTDIMHDEAFSFVCYVGMDSHKSGQEQGAMVARWVKNQYKGNKY